MSSIVETGHGLVIGHCPVKGRAVYATRGFAAGELVVPGRVIATGGRRTRMSFQKDWDRHVDLDTPACLINHSCLPNTRVVDNAAGGYDFLALVPIAAGSEITWDYETTEYEIVGMDACRCASAGCRGRLRGFGARQRAGERPRAAAAYLASPPPGGAG